MKCVFCNKNFDNKRTMWRHIEEHHPDKLMHGWSAQKTLFWMKYKRVVGKCRVCGKPTEFNEASGRPLSNCGSEACKKKLREEFQKNMIPIHGTDNLLKNDEFQRKMLLGRSICKTYKWSDGTEKQCIGSYEYDGAQFLDVVMGFASNDVEFPCPFSLTYEYNGETLTYIPDAYIYSLNTVIEFKDGGDNPNMHHKIQEVDKPKEKAKDKAMLKQKKFNYIKIENKEYSRLINFLVELREKDDVGDGKKDIQITALCEGVTLNGYVKATDNYLFYQNNQDRITIDETLNNRLECVEFRFRNNKQVFYGIRIRDYLYFSESSKIYKIDLMTNHDVKITKLYKIFEGLNKEKIINEIRNHLDYFTGKEFLVNLNDDCNNYADWSFPCHALYHLSNTFRDYIDNETEYTSCDMQYLELDNLTKDVVVFEDVTRVTSILSEFTQNLDKNIVNFRKLKLNSLMQKYITKTNIKEYSEIYNNLKHVRVDDDHTGLMYFDKDILVGFVNVCDKDHSIQSLYVSEDYRNRQVGKQLLQVAKDKLKAKNLSVNKNNEVALKMYTDFGFKQTDEDETMIYMKLTESVVPFDINELKTDQTNNKIIMGCISNSHNNLDKAIIDFLLENIDDVDNIDKIKQLHSCAYNEQLYNIPPDGIKRYIDFLMSDNNFENTFTLDDYKNIVYICNYMRTNDCRLISDEAIENKLLQIKEHTNNAVLCEATANMKNRFGMNIDKDGELLISNETNLNYMTIYNASHMLLETYEETNSYEGIKYELAKLFYMMCILDDRFIYNKSKLITTSKRTEASKTKSFVVKDFKKYLKLICENDRNFIFSKYYEETPFGKSKISVNDNFIKRLVKLIF